MFGNKKNEVNIELAKREGDVCLTVDYFNSKRKEWIRENVINHIFSSFGPFVLQIDSNFITKQYDGKEEPWMLEWIRWANENELEYDYFKFKRQPSSGLLGGILGSRIQKTGYRIGIVITKENIEAVIKRHDKIEMGIHMGGAFMEENRASLLKDYCSGLVDEQNYERYYAIDFYDYKMVNRLVMKGKDENEILELKNTIEKIVNEMA